MNHTFHTLSHQTCRTQLESALAAEPSVLDYVVLSRTTPADEPALATYVVLDTGVSLETLRARMGEASVMSCCCWISVLHLPQTADGVLDTQALLQLPVLDDFLIHAWNEVVQTKSAAGEVAVLVQDAGEPPGHLHLSDLLPQTSLQSEEQTVAASERETAPAEVASREPSLLEGRPLDLPPDLPATLPAFLRKAALEFQDERIVFIDREGQEQRQTYAAFLTAAEAVLAGLRQAGLQPEDKVILLLTHNQDILSAFWACVLGGFLPVIMAPPPSYREANSDLDRLVHVYSHLQGPFILTDEIERASIKDLEQCATPAHILFAEELRRCEPDSRHHAAQADDIALFSLTSGSTGAPKCVGLTHCNLIVRAAAVNQINGFLATDIVLCWMPLDHIVNISELHLRGVMLGSSLVYAPKEYVLGNILKWLDLIAHYKITYNWAPNFAYKLVVDAIKNRETDNNWDLSSVKALLNAGENISYAVATHFLEGLSRFGLSAHAMRPGFGMAEMGSAVTYFQVDADHSLRLHTVSRASLNSVTGVVQVSEADPDAVDFTSVGSPIPGISLRIADEKRQLLPMGRVGRLQIKGPAVSSGYYRNPEATAESFLDDGWFDTGDLGFFAEGELIITGRAKEVIIINGANFASAEIETAAEKVPGVTLSFTAACGVRMPGSQEEELAVFFTPLQWDENSLSTVLREIKAALIKALGLMPAYLIPIRSEEIPKTAIGKLQRKQLAKCLEAGEYDAVLKQVDLLLGNARTVPDWFYRRVWQRKNAVPSAAVPQTGLHLILADDQGLADALQTKLEAQGNICRLIRPGEALTPEIFTTPDASLAHMWHLRDYTPYAGKAMDADILEAAQERGAYSLLSLVQALAQSAPPANDNGLPEVGLSAAASHMQAVAPADLVACEKSPALGLLKTIAAEFSWLNCRHIDLAPDSADKNSARLLAERAGRDHEREVAWRDGERWVIRLEKALLEAKSPPAVSLEQGGFYLITGGLGGMGAEIARFLLERHAAKLLLAGKTSLPEMETDADTPDAKTAARIAAWRGLQKLPGKVHYQALDVGDSVTLEQAVTEAEARWQTRLSGVFHLAGIAREQFLVDETHAGLAAALHPKLAGTLAVQQLLNARPGAFSMFSSSVFGFFGAGALGAYAASNAFLDSFSACQQAHHGRRSFSFAWGMWDDTGMSQGSSMRTVLEAKGYTPISVQEGIRSLLAGLAQGRSCLLVGLNGAKPHIRRQRADVPANAR
ncbi:MAG: SDR family NAD(P)-dependent oxidoreductase [Gammaproteobacteria bacterium]|nr:SDR family NAD(P)-dependent oxidoreductase [Gammaproteobacteria bacterium]